MTPEDIDQIRQIVAESESRTTERFTAAIRDSESRTMDRLAEPESRTAERLTETMREMQSEILRGLERFARGNFARMVRLETSDSTTAERLNAIEERPLALETRPPRP